MECTFGIKRLNTWEVLFELNSSSHIREDGERH